MTYFDSHFNSICRYPICDHDLIRYYSENMYDVRVSSLLIPYDGNGDACDPLTGLSDLLHIINIGLLSMRLGELPRALQGYLRCEADPEKRVEAVYCLLHYFVPYDCKDYGKVKIESENKDIGIIRDFVRICAKSLLDPDDKLKPGDKNSFCLLCDENIIDKSDDEIGTIINRVYELIEEDYFRAAVSENQDIFDAVDELFDEDSFYDLYFISDPDNEFSCDTYGLENEDPEQYDQERIAPLIVSHLLIDPILNFHRLKQQEEPTFFQRYMDSL